MDISGKEVKTVKAGTLLAVSDGSYSSYQIKGFFVVLTDFQHEELLQEFCPVDTVPDNPTRVHFEPTAFLAFLLRKGLLLEVNYNELWCGDYGRAYGDDGVKLWSHGTSR